MAHPVYALSVIGVGSLMRFANIPPPDEVMRVLADRT